MQPVSPWWNRVAPIAAVLSAAIAFASLVFGGGIVFQQLINVPHLEYAALPPYELADSSLVGVTLENRGRATAHDVLMRVSLSGSPVQQYSVSSLDPSRVVDGGQGAQFLLVSLDRMVGGSSATTYILTSKNGSLDSVTVTSEEGQGRERTADVAFINPRSPSDVIAYIGLMLATFYALYRSIRNLRDSIRRLLVEDVRNPRPR
jgi:hypothetical protein